MENAQSTRRRRAQAFNPTRPALPTAQQTIERRLAGLKRKKNKNRIKTKETRELTTSSASQPTFPFLPFPHGFARCLRFSSNAQHRPAPVTTYTSKWPGLTFVRDVSKPDWPSKDSTKPVTRHHNPSSFSLSYSNLSLCLFHSFFSFIRPLNSLFLFLRFVRLDTAWMSQWSGSPREK